MLKLIKLKELIKGKCSINIELLSSFISYQFSNAKDNEEVSFKLFNNYLNKNGFSILIPNTLIENEEDILFIHFVKEKIRFKMHEQYKNLLQYDIPLKGAISTNNLSLVMELIKEGADVNIRGAYYKIEDSPLCHSLRTGNRAIFDALLEAKADVNFSHPFYRRDTTALTCALQYNRTEQLLKLLAHGAKVTKCTYDDYDIIGKFPEVNQRALGYINHFEILEKFQWMQNQEKLFKKYQPSIEHIAVMQEKTTLPDAVIHMITEYCNFDKTYLQQATCFNPKELRFPYRFFNPIKQKSTKPMIYGEEILEAVRKLEMLSYEHFKTFINEFIRKVRLNIYIEAGSNKDDLLFKLEQEPLLGKLKAIEEYLMKRHSYQSSFMQYFMNTISTIPEMTEVEYKREGQQRC